MGKNRIHFLYLATLLICAILFFGLGHFSYPLFYQTGFYPIGLPQAPLAEDRALAGADPVDLQLFWEVWHVLERDFYGDEPEPVARVHGVLKGLADSYHDPYTFFEAPPRAQVSGDTLRGVYGDIGADLELREEGYFLNPEPGLPADKAGIRAGDQLTRIDDLAVTPQLDPDEVRIGLRGEPESQVEIAVLRATEGDSAALTFLVERIEIAAQNTTWWLLNDDPLTATVGVIKQKTFTDQSANDMRNAIAELRAAGADRILLDLRESPGGTVKTAIEVIDMWIDHGRLLVERHQDGSETVIEAKPDGEAVDLPLTVLIGKDTASAGEMVAGALQDHGRALLVGERSVGKGTLQLIHHLSDNSSLRVTHAEWFTPHGREVDKVGLTPDLPIEPGIDPIPQAVALLAAQAHGSSQVVAER